MINSLFSPEELLPCPLHSEGETDKLYKKEWAKFAKTAPLYDIMGTLAFMDTLKERAARERNFEAMAIYGMPQWFFNANRDEVIARRNKNVCG